MFGSSKFGSILEMAIEFFASFDEPAVEYCMRVVRVPEHGQEEQFDEEFFHCHVRAPSVQVAAASMGLIMAVRRISLPRGVKLGIVATAAVECPPEFADMVQEAAEAHVAQTASTAANELFERMGVTVTTGRAPRH